MRHKGISRLKMTIAVVAAATIALAAVGYLILAAAPAGCPGCGDKVDGVTVTESLGFPSGYGVSELNIEVNNTAKDPIWTIEVTNSSGLPGSTFMAFYHNTFIVSAANALTVDQTAAGSTSVRNVTAGATYTLSMEFIFSTGAEQNMTLQVTAGS
jgi:hypothetical protein